MTTTILTGWDDRISVLSGSCRATITIGTETLAVRAGRRNP